MHSWCNMPLKSKKIVSRTFTFDHTNWALLRYSRSRLPPLGHLNLSFNVIPVDSPMFCHHLWHRSVALHHCWLHCIPDYFAVTRFFWKNCMGSINWYVNFMSTFFDCDSFINISLIFSVFTGCWSGWVTRMVVFINNFMAISETLIQNLGRFNVKSLIHFSYKPK